MTPHLAFSLGVTVGIALLGIAQHFYGVCK